MSDAFKNSIHAALQRNAPREDFIAMLSEFRDRGVSADSAYAALQSLRAGAGEEIEDRILEIMDIVSGFCAPDLRIWKK